MTQEPERIADAGARIRAVLAVGPDRAQEILGDLAKRKLPYLGRVKTPMEWATAVQAAREVAIAFAGRRSMVTYGELKYAAFLATGKLVGYSQFPNLAMETNRRDDSVLLSSIIVRKDTGRPGDGFRPYAISQGFDAPLDVLQRAVFDRFSGSHAQPPMRILVPTSGPDDWRPLLAEPTKHWVRGRSAWETAHAWERAKGFPEAVRAVLDASGIPELISLEPIVGFPEWETPLPGGDRASQTDLLVVARNGLGTVVVGVEAKVDEAFGPPVSEWDPDSTPGRRTRLDFLCRMLGIDTSAVGPLRYQLLHRGTAASLEADRFGAGTSLLLVHSFSPDAAGFEDYAAFVRALGGEPAVGAVTTIGPHRFAAWVQDGIAQ